MGNGVPRRKNEATQRLRRKLWKMGTVCAKSQPWIVINSVCESLQMDIKESQKSGWTHHGKDFAIVLSGTDTKDP